MRSRNNGEKESIRMNFQTPTFMRIKRVLRVRIESSSYSRRFLENNALEGGFPAKSTKRTYFPGNRIDTSLS